MTFPVEPVGGWTTESVTHGQCDARPTVTSPAAERHRPLADTKLYCLVTEAHGCEQLSQSCYLLGVELATFRSRANALTTEPPTWIWVVRNSVDLVLIWLNLNVLDPVLTRVCCK